MSIGGWWRVGARSMRIESSFVHRATEMHAGHGTTEGRACMRGALRIRVMGKSIRGRANSKVAGQGVVDTRRNLPPSSSVRFTHLEAEL